MQSDRQHPFRRRGPRLSYDPVLFGRAAPCDLVKVRGAADDNDRAYGALPDLIAGLAVSGVAQIQHARQQLAFRMANGAPSSAVPGLDTSNLRWWFQADAITGLVDGNSIATWSDSGPGGHDLYQPGGSAFEFIYKTYIQNGLPVASGYVVTSGPNANDGSYMIFSDLPTFARGDSSFYFAINEHLPQIYTGNNASSGKGTLIEIVGDTFDADGSSAFYIWANLNQQFTYMLDWPYVTSNIVAAPGIPAVSGWQVFTLVLDRTHSQVRLYRNAVLLQTNAYTYVAHNDEYVLFGVTAATNEAFQGDWGDMVHYGVAHTDAQVAANAGALMTKWGIS